MWKWILSWMGRSECLSCRCWKEPLLSDSVSITPGVQRLALDFLRDNTVGASERGRREAGVVERHFHPQSLLASLALAQGERETERETAPSTSPLTYISSVAFFHSSLFPPSLISPVHQKLRNCDVMTKAGVIKSQTGQDEMLLKTCRQKRPIKKRGDRQGGG